MKIEKTWNILVQQPILFYPKNPWTTVLNFIDFRDKKNALIVLKLENIYIPPNNLLITTKREENTYIPLKWRLKFKSLKSKRVRSGKQRYDNCAF